MQRNRRHWTNVIWMGLKHLIFVCPWQYKPHVYNFFLHVYFFGQTYSHPLWMFVSWKSTCKTLCASRWIVHIIFWSLIKKSMKHIKLNKLPRTSIIIITPLKLPNWKFNSKINICLFVPTLKKQFWKTTKN